MDGLGGGWVQKHVQRGKWQGVIKWYDYDTTKPHEEGKPYPKVWHRMSKLFDIPCDPDPKSMKGQRSAEAALKEWRRSLMEGTDERTTEHYSTVHEYTEKAIEGRKSKHGGGELAPHTKDDYMRMLRYIDGGEFPSGRIDGIGSIRVENLRKKDVAEWVRQMQGAYAAPTVRKALMVLRDLGLQLAIEDEAIEKNPAEGITVADVEAREPNYLTNDSLRTLLEELSSKGTNRYGVAIATALFTGLREGELCGLRWADIAFEWDRETGQATGGTLTVKRVIARSGNSFVVREKPKNRSSHRTIPLGGAAETLGRRYRAIAEEYAQKVGGSNLECYRAVQRLYVFGRIDGHNLNPRMLWKAWRRTVKELNLIGSEGTPPTFHDLRHTFATTAVASGVGMNDVQKILGHSSIKTTMDIYAATEQQSLQKASTVASAEIRRRGQEADVITFPPTGTEG